MAEKSFGVKDLNMVGSSGDPTIESNGDLNLKAGQVAIQTNTAVTGVVTATSFVGGGAGITGISTTNITNYQVGSGGGVTVEDEGSALSTTATTLNFVGDGVVASGTGAEKQLLLLVDLSLQT